MFSDIYIVSKDAKRQKEIKMQLEICFPDTSIHSHIFVHSIHQKLSDANAVIIYDSLSLGSVPENYLIEAGGCWVNLASDDNETCQLDSLISGFSGILSTQEPLDNLPRIIRCLAKGQIWFSRSILSLALKHYQSKALVSKDMLEFAITNLSLTFREKELVKLMLLGISNQEIADTLCISIHTVKTHVSRILNKLNLQSRNELHHVINQRVIEIANYRNLEEYEEKNSI